MELKQKVVHGLKWNLAGSFFIQILNLFTKIFIARLLLPADFGLFAMAVILINFLNIFVGFGLMGAVICKKDDPEKTFNTAFVVTFFIGIVLSLLSFFSSGFIAAFFNEPALEKMIWALSIVFLFDSLSAVLNGHLLRSLEYKKKSIAEIASIFCYSAIAVSLAIFGFGVWSLILAYVVQHGFLLFFLWISCKIKPKIEVDKKIALEILHLGKYMTFTAVLSWAITSIDNAIVGKQLGDESLGYYSFGFNIAALPVLGMTHIITSVFHPIYARLQDEKERLRQAYIKPLEICLLLMLPLSFGMFLLADIIVLVIFGEKWVLMTPLLRVFAIYCLFRTVCTIISHLLEGIGKPNIASLLLGIELFFLIIILYPAITYAGIAGVAIAVVLARGFSMVLHLFQIKKLIFVSLKDYYKIFWKKIVSTLIMGIVVYFLRNIFSGNSLLILIFLIFMGVLTYSIALFFLERNIFTEVRQSLASSEK
jgi:O-antigen/teichoic acid export membrane protein